MGRGDSILSGVPSGFANALAADPAAFQSFLALDDEGQRAMIHRARNAHSKAEMRALAQSLHG